LKQSFIYEEQGVNNGEIINRCILLPYGPNFIFLNHETM
jgi:hypothetical protein